MNQKQIFDHIADLVTRIEFNEAQAEFYSTNCHKFEDTEEQKHEYKQIYEEFLHIIDQMIGAKMKLEFGYAEEELNRFYEAFKTDFEQYRALHSHVVDTLFEVIDFEKFRKSMIDFQKGMKDDVEKATTSAIEFQGTPEEDFASVFGEDLNDKATGWRRKLHNDIEKDGYSLEVHQREQANYGVDLIRSEALLKGVSAEVIINFWIDPPTEKMACVKEKRVIEKTEDFTVQYWRMVLPLMTDRELVFKQSCKKFGRGTLFSLQTVDRADVPQAENTVRMAQKVHAYVRPSEENPSDIEYTEIQVMDLRGSMPARLLNMTVASEVQKGIKEMYQIAKA